ncbi:S26 family signal peptidase [Kitasatospora sp. NBC_01250]|uniref:S26 family signal peptidase n=1 Tax=Kitasatospora sp. NBC_01250 TaxID=2903571 RepID=UPI002E308F0C|nr:S26 family signal peptidase [Kitasatospora sp. NBC_01250]
MIERLVRRLLRTRLLAVTVTGPSMEPSLRNGDRVLVMRRHPRRLSRGHIVVLGPDGARRVPGAGPRGLLIKRIAAAPGDLVPPPLATRLGCPPGSTVPPGQLLVLGDNPGLSLDSRHFGYVAQDRVVGVAVRSLRRGPAGS